MDSYFWPFIGTVIASFIGLASGVWAYKKNKADATGMLVNTALSLVKQYEASLQTYNDRLIAAENRAIAAETRVDELEEKIQALEEQLESLGYTPKTKIKKGEKNESKSK